MTKKRPFHFGWVLLFSYNFIIHSLFESISDMQLFTLMVKWNKYPTTIYHDIIACLF